jgi:hypothetical protein
MKYFGFHRRSWSCSGIREVALKQLGGRSAVRARMGRCGAVSRRVDTGGSMLNAKKTDGRLSTMASDE